MMAANGVGHHGGRMRYQFMSGARRLMPGGGEGSNDRLTTGVFRLYGLPPGDYYVSANNRGNMMVMPGMNNTEPEGFAPTYYPGTPNVSDAARVTVKGRAGNVRRQLRVDHRADGAPPRPRGEFQWTAV